MLKLVNYQNNKQKGFSLFEVGIVIFLISIILISVTGGKRFVQYARRAAAATLTASSPVTYIDDLTLWLESSLHDSFEVDRYGKVSIWYDRSGKGNDVAQSTTDKKPQLVKDGIGGAFQAVKFDGVDDFLENNILDYTSDSTLFIVYKSNGAQVGNNALFSSATGGSTIPDSYQVGYGYGTNILSFTYTDSLGTASAFIPIEDEINTNDNIVSFVMDGISNAKAYHNGELKIDLTSATGFLSFYERYRVGLNRSSGATQHFFNGYIAEVILYNRALYDSERQQVEEYLSNKYRINLQ